MKVLEIISEILVKPLESTLPSLGNLQTCEYLLHNEARR
jgi:hypothetical protein